MQPGKGYSLTMQNPRVTPKTCAILTEARVAVTPMNGALRFGGTMEIAGMNESINPRRVAGIVRAASEYYPQFSAEDFAQIPPWRGLRPCSPDGLPYLGRTVFYDNLTIATGHAMMGLSLGPISGRIVANIIAGEPTGFDLRMLSPDRYA
jgi:D-amino-acid dehydrogenase